MIWHIRKGIHWQNKAPVNGREYTADDAVFNLTRWLNIKASWMYMNYVPSGLRANFRQGPGQVDR